MIILMILQILNATYIAYNIIELNFLFFNWLKDCHHMNPKEIFINLLIPF